MLAVCAFSPVFGVEKSDSAKPDHKPSDGPGITKNPNPHERGDAAAGKNVFRFEMHSRALLVSANWKSSMPP